MRRCLLSVVPLALLTGCAATPAQPASHGRSEPVIDAIAFGSCAREEREQPVWDAVLAQKPDLFLFIGDNMYADAPEVPNEVGTIEEAYAMLGAQPGYARLTQTVPVLATWDDHDYGKNDAGKEWFLREESQRAFLDFFGVPQDSERRSREGVYHAQTFGPEGRRVQVILLDTRYHRDALDRADPRPADRGPYRGTTDESRTMLGEAQWTWLEGVLREPAEVRLIASSIQVVPEESGWEVWANMPHERDRLFRTIARTNASGVLFLSGDRHHMEISRTVDTPTPYPMWDFTSSGLNEPEREKDEPNRHRVGPIYRGTNFGMVRIDWNASGGPVVRLTAHGVDGRKLAESEVAIRTLRE